MKSISLILFLGLFISFSSVAYAQSDTIQIKTNAKTEHCKAKLEKALMYEKGVKSAVLNLQTYTVKVVYNPNKTTVANIKKAIVSAGYDANEMKSSNNKPKSSAPCKKHCGGCKHH